MKDLKENPALSLGMLVAILLGGGSGAVSIFGNGGGKADAAEAKKEAVALAERLTKMDARLDEIVRDREAIVEIKGKLSKHWYLHGWARDEINVVRLNNQLSPVRWPKLDDP